jgi:hypothetical protein
MPDQDFSVSSMAKSIAQDVAAAPGTLFGAGILAAVLPPPGTPAVYFDQSYTLITSVAQQSIAQDDRTAISGGLDTVRQWASTYNRPLTGSTDAVQQQTDGLVANVIQPLMSAQRAEPGLSVFLLAAGMHLALLQEMSNFGTDSVAISSMKQAAQQYHDFTTSTWQAIISARTNTNVITPVVFSQSVIVNLFGSSAWTDLFTNYTDNVVGAPGLDSTAQATADRNAYIAALAASLDSAIGASAVAASFLAIANTPLPTTTGFNFNPLGGLGQGPNQSPV